jgi:amino acid permease
MKIFFLKFTILILNIFIILGIAGFSPVAFADNEPYNIMTNGGGDSFGVKAGYTAVTDPTASIAQKVASVISIALSFLGVIFLILMIYAGFLWMTAHGNDAQIKTATTTMQRAVIGLIIVASAYIITAFVGRTLATTTG